MQRIAENIAEDRTDDDAPAVVYLCRHTVESRTVGYFGGIQLQTIARSATSRAMTRPELEHIIGAAVAIADDRDVFVIGSQSILGQFRDALAEFPVSVEADVYALVYPERSDLIDGAIGDG